MQRECTVFLWLTFPVFFRGSFCRPQPHQLVYDGAGDQLVLPNGMLDIELTAVAPSVMRLLE